MAFNCSNCLELDFVSLNYVMQLVWLLGRTGYPIECDLASGLVRFFYDSGHDMCRMRFH